MSRMTGRAPLIARVLFTECFLSAVKGVKLWFLGKYTRAMCAVVLVTCSICRQ